MDQALIHPADLESVESRSDCSIVYEKHVDDVVKEGFCLPDTVEHRTFRLISCAAFLDSSLVQIMAVDSLSAVAFAAVSYVWDGLPPLMKTHDDFFPLPETGGNHFVCVQILRSLCQLARMKGVDYAWIDALCIKQNSDGDKVWQIPRMSDLYSACDFCIVVPSGLRRLARLGLREGTTWMMRCWTLQEMLLPPKLFVLYGWRHGSGTIKDSNELMRVEDIDGMHHKSLEYSSHLDD